MGDLIKIGGRLVGATKKEQGDIEGQRPPPTPSANGRQARAPFVTGDPLLFDSAYGFSRAAGVIQMTPARLCQCQLLSSVDPHRLLENRNRRAPSPPGVLHGQREAGHGELCAPGENREEKMTASGAGLKY